jgi:UDP-galactopyranose mutase
MADALFFSHLRWDFVFQRPQQLVTRWADDHRCFFWEEPVADATSPHLELCDRSPVTVVVPHVVPDRPVEPQLAALVDALIEQKDIVDPVLWYWTPMMRPFSRHVVGRAVVWDCMDELSGFAFAPPSLIQREAELLEDAHLVFTGGYELYRSKRDRHPAVYPFPSSVDVAHFARARAEGLKDPFDQAAVPRPRVGWFGVIDERMDLELVDRVAADHPAWGFVLIGPVVKITPEMLPRRPNLHWLGMKPYDALPAYIAHWDVAILPFAHNPATRYISPTKTPEYLAAGRPVVSTSIADVVRPYGERGLVRIADTPEAFGQAIAAALAEDPDRRRARADAFLARLSWEDTVRRMKELVAARSVRRQLAAVG